MFWPRDFSLFQDAQIGSWTTHPYMRLVRGYIFPGGKAVGAWRWALTSAEINKWSCTSCACICLLSHACERLLNGNAAVGFANIDTMVHADYSMSKAVTKHCADVQGDFLARGPKLLSIKNYVIIMLLRKWLENLYTHTGNDAKQDLLIIDAKNGLLSISIT